MWNVVVVVAVVVGVAVVIMVVIVMESCAPASVSSRSKRDGGRDTRVTTIERKA